MLNLSPCPSGVTAMDALFLALSTLLFGLAVGLALAAHRLGGRS